MGWLAVGEIGMARKRYSNGDILRFLLEIELHRAGGSDAAMAFFKYSDRTRWFNGRYSERPALRGDYRR
jgi:hypothetical protein